jgi:hypothetical protein
VFGLNPCTAMLRPGSPLLTRGQRCGRQEAACRHEEVQRCCSSPVCSSGIQYVRQGADPAMRLLKQPSIGHIMSCSTAIEACRSF